MQGIGFSEIESGFFIENYLPNGYVGIGSAVIESSFIIESYTALPVLNSNYRTHKSNVLLGNVQAGRKSKKYFKYKTWQTDLTG